MKVTAKRREGRRTVLVEVVGSTLSGLFRRAFGVSVTDLRLFDATAGGGQDGSKTCPRRVQDPSSIHPRLGGNHTLLHGCVDSISITRKPPVYTLAWPGYGILTMPNIAVFYCAVSRFPGCHTPTMLLGLLEMLEAARSAGWMPHASLSSDES